MPTATPEREGRGQTWGFSLGDRTVMDSLPPSLRENVDAIRHYGNFGAHPNRNRITGEIVDVEHGEAEWTLKILLSLNEHYIVNPLSMQKEERSLIPSYRTRVSMV
jgi:Domain of unknown function (DUF4145)